LNETADAVSARPRFAREKNFQKLFNIKTIFYNQGQTSTGIIIVLVVVGLITGGLYFYFFEPEEEVVPPSEEELPREEITSPEETTPEEEIIPTCQNECSQTGFKKCSNNSYQVCGNYDADNCLEWSSTTNCPSNTICQNGICIQQKCIDETPYGQCSANKPKYCQNGNLIDKCSICGCPLNKYCEESSGLCSVTEKVDMLIFISPQYANNTQIKQAINGYVDAVEEDINWETKIITITPDINDFRRIDEIIEDYYIKSGSKLKACIMVGEDIHTALGGDTDYTESPSTLPWSTTGGETAYEIEYHFHPGPDTEQIASKTGQIDIAISLIYPTHELDYQTKSSQIASVFTKFSENRTLSYPKDIAVFISTEDFSENTHETYQTLNNYGNLYYKEDATRSEVVESLTKSYMMYNVAGHSSPGGTTMGYGVLFFSDDLNKLNTPLFTAHGCGVSGWFTDCPGCEDTNNGILDFSINKSWYGSKIFINPYIRTMVLGFPAQPADMGNLNFIINAMPGLSKGKTLAESVAGHTYTQIDDVIIYGDPTFHYNF